MSDLVHEIAHSFEETHPDELYEDGLLQQEFLGKRQKLFTTLKVRGFPVKIQDFQNIDYDKTFDEFLYSTVGYEALGNMTHGLFISPYAATSLREYFANAFEEFFVNDVKTIQTISPEVYKKILDYLEF